MKFKIYAIAVFAFNCLVAISQPVTPHLINYQGVVRNPSGLPLSNKTISIKFDIREQGASGPVIFTEPQTVSTNSLGLFSTQIGKINNLGVVSWINGPYFLALFVDTTGGSTYTFIGNQQVVSVPYALYADKAGNATTYSASANITISGSGVIDLSDLLSSPSVTAGGTGIALSRVPVISADIKGRLTSVGEYSANTSGDISGPLNNQTVNKLQGTPLSGVTPTVGQILQYNATGWGPVTPGISAGPWSYSSGNIFPSNNISNDKVNIGTNGGGGLLNVNNTASGSLLSGPIVSVQNTNGSYNGSPGILSVANFSGSGAAVYIQNNVPGNNSNGIIVNMSNTVNTSGGINVTHVGQGNAGIFTTTNPFTPSDAVVATSNASGAFALKAINSGSGAAMQATNNAMAATAQFLNGGPGNVIYSSSNSSNAGIISYNGGTGVAIHGLNTNTVASGGAHGVIGQTGNPSSAGNGVLGINTNAGTGVYGLNNYTIGSVSAHGVRGETNNPAAQAAGVSGQNYNVGAGVSGINSYSISSGNAFGVYGEVNNPAVNSSGVFGRNYGTGNGVTGMTGSTASNAAAIFGDNGGAGYAVYGVKQGSSNGNAARFDNLNSANSADALFAFTQGSGAAVHAQTGTLTTSALSLLIEAGHIRAAGPMIGITSTSVNNGFAPITNQSCICNDVRGTVSFFTSATGFSTPNFAEVTITFAKPYSLPPVVSLTPMLDMQNISYMVTNVTTTGFTIRIYRSANTAGGSLSSTIPSSQFKFNYFVIE